jgi:hypothetical protein
MRFDLLLHRSITSGVRRFTFSRAVVPLEIRFVLMTLDNVTLTGRFPIAGHRPKSRYLQTITGRPAADREDP